MSATSFLAVEQEVNRQGASAVRDDQLKKLEARYMTTGHVVEDPAGPFNPRAGLLQRRII